MYYADFEISAALRQRLQSFRLIFVLLLCHAMPLMSGCGKAVVDADWETGFVQRGGHLLRYVTEEWQQPFPNFANAQMHYYATAVALLALNDFRMDLPALHAGDTTSNRPPIYWGILKYDGEPIPVAGAEPPPRGTRQHVTFSWQPNLFHFNFPGLAYLIGVFPDLPVWQDPHHRNPAETYREHYLRMVLSQTNNFNAFTGEGTENHINMSRPPAWVLAREAQRLGISDPAAPYTAAERVEQMKDWMRGWAKRIYEVGIGEWDSGIYHAVSMQGWFVAHDYAHTEHGWDPEVQLITRAVLDYYAIMLAWKHLDLQIAGAEKRTTQRFDKIRSGTGYLAYLWFETSEQAPAGPLHGGEIGEIVYAVASPYRPPMAAIELARKGRMAPQPMAATGETYTGFKPSYLLQDGRQSLEVLHLGPDYILGSANMRIGGFFSSSWQILPWKLLVHGTAEQPFPEVLSGNGGFYGMGRINTRDPWMQLVQHRQTLLQMHRVPENAAAIVAEMRAYADLAMQRWHEDFTARFTDPDWGGFGGEVINGDKSPIRFQAETGDVEAARTGFVVYPAGSEVRHQENFAFIRIRDTYVALRSISGAALQWDAEARLLADTVLPGELGGLVVEVGSRVEWSDFDSFIDAVVSGTRMEREGDTLWYLTLAGDLLEAVYQTEGCWQEPDYDANFGVRQPLGVALMHAAGWRQVDWPCGYGHGRMPTYRVNLQPLHVPLGTVVSGPRLRLANGRLSILSENGERYAVDFSGDLPEFHTFEP